MENPGATISDLAQRSHIERTSCYRSLGTLEQQHLVYKEKNGRGYCYFPEHPHKIEDMFSRFWADSKSLMPLLLSLYKSPTSKTHVGLLRGDQLKKELVHIIKHTKIGSEWIGISHPLVLFPLFDEKQWKHIVTLRTQRHITSKLIQNEVGETVPGYKAGEDWQKYRIIKIIDKKIFPIESMLWLVGKKLIMIPSYKNQKDILGIVIENADLARTFTSIFQFIWKRL